MQEIIDLQCKIENLLLLNKVVLLRYAGSKWQENFINSLCDGRKIIDFADPVLRENATLRQEDITKSDNESFVVYNIQYAVDVLSVLQDSGCTSTFLILVKQSADILDECSVYGFPVLDLPLNYEDKAPYLPDKAYLVNLQQQNLLNTANDVFLKIINGSLADDFCDDAARSQFFSAYIKKFLQYDVKEMTVVSDELKFYRFMCFIAANSGSVVNYAQLGKAADVSSPTAKQWLKYLEGAGIVVLLYPIDNAGLKRIAKAPKVYFRDTGLACYLMKINSRNELVNSPFINMFFETWVVMRIRESYLQNGSAPQFSYYRDSNAKEISLLIKNDVALYPVEIKREAVNVKKLEKKFSLLREALADGDLTVADGSIIGMYKTPEQVNENLWQVPAAWI